MDSRAQFKYGGDISEQVINQYSSYIKWKLGTVEKVKENQIIEEVWKYDHQLRQDLNKYKVLKKKDEGKSKSPARQIEPTPDTYNSDKFAKIQIFQNKQTPSI